MLYRKRMGLIVGILLILLYTPAAMAASDIKKEQFDEIYQSIVKKMRSSASLKEKMEFLKTKDNEYVLKGKKLREEAKTNPTKRKTQTISYAWDLYDQIIPLLNLEMDAGNTKLTKKSCLEMISLVQFSESPPPSEKPWPKLSRRSQATMNLINELCRDSLK